MSDVQIEEMFLEVSKTFGKIIEYISATTTKIEGLEQEQINLNERISLRGLLAMNEVKALGALNKRIDILEERGNY